MNFVLGRARKFREISSTILLQLDHAFKAPNRPGGTWRVQIALWPVLAYRCTLVGELLAIVYSVGNGIG
jgi:hypothetical protein